MNPKPTPTTPDPTEDDPVTESAPAPADDGTVPEKQISRWQGEGGAAHPEEQTP